MPISYSVAIWSMAFFLGAACGGLDTSQPEVHPADGQDTTHVTDIGLFTDGNEADPGPTDSVGDPDVEPQDGSSVDVMAPEISVAFLPCTITADVSCGEQIESVKNDGEKSTKSMGWYACQPEEDAHYAASPERTYRFRPTSKARVLLTETTETSIHVIVIHEQGAGCMPTPEACVGVDEQAVMWDVNPGETYYLVFDSSEGSIEEFSARLTCCEPFCDGRDCGSDGCGGLCGDCGEGDVCDGGTCVDGSSLTCNPSTELGCGQVLEGETFLSFDTTTSVDAVGCTADATLGPERAYSLNVFQPGLVTVEVTQAEDAVAAVFLLDATLSACEPDACVVGGKTSATLKTLDGGSYTVLVEGKEEADGVFDISVTCCSPSCGGKECGSDGCGGSCGECVADKICDGGECVPFPEPTCTPVSEISCGTQMANVMLDGATGTNNVFSASCNDGDLSGAEKAFTFKADQDAVVSFTAETEAFQEGVAVMLLEDVGDGCNAMSCVAGGLGTLTVEVEAGKSYFLLLDGLEGEEGEIALETTCCFPQCEGKTCGPDGCGGSCGSCEPGLICSGGDCLPAPEPMCVPAKSISCGDSIDGDLSLGEGATDNVYAYGCNPFDYGGSELAYTLDVPANTKIEATLSDGDGAGELDLFLVGGDDGTCDASQCVAWGSDSLTFSALAGVPSYLVVDGFMGAEGTFNLSLECCFPVCMLESCGQGDGCGGICGCGDGLVCFEATCQEPGKGNDCEVPWPIPSLPFEKSASTQGAFTDSFHTAGGCGSVFDVGKGQADVVYSFVPPKTGGYEIGLQDVTPGQTPTVVYAFTDCNDTGGTCLGYLEFGGLDPIASTLIVELVEGENTLIVVDGIGAGDEGSFKFTMDGPIF